MKNSNKSKKRWQKIEYFLCMAEIVYKTEKHITIKTLRTVKTEDLNGFN